MRPWYQIDNIATVDTPQVVVYAERVQHNIDAAIRMVGDVRRLRPHVKTNKTAEVAQMMLDAGITRFKCATIEEAEMLAGLGAPDVLLAYQPVGPKIDRFFSLIQQYPSVQFSCLTDHADAASAMAAFFTQRGQRVSVFIDLNVGMNRTGITPDQAPALVSRLQTLQGIHLRGLHAYDGHLRDPDLQARKEKCDAGFSKVKALKVALDAAYGLDLLLVAGGSPSFPIHAGREGVECSPGTFVFWDKGYSDICPEQPFLPSAVVVSRVISLPAPGTMCLDMGHKSIAAENEISRRAWFINEPEASLLGQSEEHGLVQTAVPHKPGDILYVMPYHVCPTINLYSSIVVVKDGMATGRWKVAAKH